MATITRSNRLTARQVHRPRPGRSIRPPVFCGTQTTLEFKPLTGDGRALGRSLGPRSGGPARVPRLVVAEGATPESVRAEATLLAERAPCLTGLQICGAGMNEATLGAVIDVLGSRLEVLDLLKGPRLLPTRSMPLLRRLCLRDVDAGPDAIAAMIGQAPNLERLDLCGAANLDGPGACAFLSRLGPEIQVRLDADHPFSRRRLTLLGLVGDGLGSRVYFGDRTLDDLVRISGPEEA